MTRGPDEDLVLLELESSISGTTTMSFLRDIHAMRWELYQRALTGAVVFGHSGRHVPIQTPPKSGEGQPFGDRSRVWTITVDQQVPNGFSGGPLLLADHDGFHCAGIAKRGGEAANHAMFIAADCVLHFLELLKVAVDTRPAEEVMTESRDEWSVDGAKDGPLRGLYPALPWLVALLALVVLNPGLWLRAGSFATAATFLGTALLLWFVPLRLRSRGQRQWPREALVFLAWGPPFATVGAWYLSFLCGSWLRYLSAGVPLVVLGACLAWHPAWGHGFRWPYWVRSPLGISVTVTVLVVPHLLGAPLALRPVSCDLSGADLSGLDLRGLHAPEGKALKMVNTNLSGADLSGSDLRAAQLSSAIVTGAKLDDAKLEGACFYGADLRCAKLAAAHVKGADFSGADLRGATLEQARLELALGDDDTLLSSEFRIPCGLVDCASIMFGQTVYADGDQACGTKCRATCCGENSDVKCSRTAVASNVPIACEGGEP